MKRYLAWFAPLLLAACMGVTTSPPPVVVYDFGLPAGRFATDSSWSRIALDVRSPSWFESLNIDYRLAYEDATNPREYANSRWAGTPAVLLAQRLRQQFGMVSASGNAAADCLLRVELQEFSQVFDSPQASRGVLLSSLSLIDAKRQLIAEHQLNVDFPAASPNAAGGVRALVAAADEFGRRLADWLNEIEAKGTSRSCLGGLRGKFGT